MRESLITKGMKIEVSNLFILSVWGWRVFEPFDLCSKWVYVYCRKNSVCVREKRRNQMTRWQMDRRAKKLFDRPKQLALAVFRAELNWTAVCDYREEQIHVHVTCNLLWVIKGQSVLTRDERERESCCWWWIIYLWLKLASASFCFYVCVLRFEWHLQLMQLKRLCR